MAMDETHKVYVQKILEESGSSSSSSSSRIETRTFRGTVGTSNNRVQLTLHEVRAPNSKSTSLVIFA